MRPKRRNSLPTSPWLHLTRSRHQVRKPVLEVVRKNHSHRQQQQEVQSRYLSFGFARLRAALTFSVGAGQVPTPQDRFTTHNQKEFSPVNFRRYLEAPELLEKKDYQDYATSINHEKFNQKNQILHDASPSAVNSICSRTGTNFMNNSAMRTKRPLSILDSPSIDIKTSTIKPKLLETKILNQQQFFNMSDGFQKIFTNDNRDSNLVIPISGYKGHKRGDKSQNFFGRSFRDCAIQSKKLERNLKGNKKY